MKKYTVQVCMTFVHIIDVEADSQSEAEEKAFDSFDLNKAYQGEGECWTISIDGEPK